MRVIGTILIMISLLTIQSATIAWGEEKHTTWNPTAEERVNHPTWMPANPDDVSVGIDGISMPLGRMLLARKGSEYCVVKFTNTWLGETEQDHYSSYEFFYQGDGSGDFTRSNVLSGAAELYFPRVRPILYIMGGYQKGRNSTFKCGSIEIDWLFIAYVRFPRKCELAPTSWTSIKEVNVNDPRVRWYKKNDVRKIITLPIDQLWKSTGKSNKENDQK